MMIEKCPACQTPLDLTPPLEINQAIICPNCDLELEVIWLYPLELAKVISYHPDPNRRKKTPNRNLSDKYSEI